MNTYITLDPKLWKLEKQGREIIKAWGGKKRHKQDNRAIAEALAKL